MAAQLLQRGASSHLLQTPLRCGLKLSSIGRVTVKPLKNRGIRVAMGSEAKEPRVLTVAGSDSGAGAGIQADMKACGALGVYCSTAITALTAQNSVGVQVCPHCLQRPRNRVLNLQEI